jgi:protein-tyrosine phosphatase
MKDNFPNQYKVLDQSLPGKIAGSAQPGRMENDTKDLRILANLKKNLSPQEAGVDSELMSNLTSIHNDGITIIYCLLGDGADRKTALLKHLWEHIDPANQYILKINDLDIEIDDFAAPSREQLEIITNDAISKMQEGKNILVHCRGGMGRTGTILAAIYMKIHREFDGEKAINQVRENYNYHAVESRAQEESLKEFGRNLSRNTSFAEKERERKNSISESMNLI